MRSIFLFIALGLTFACSSPDSPSPEVNEPPVPVTPEPVDTNKFLALGDSYTIGQSVCEDCRWPAQLRDSISLQTGIEPELRIIATTGWTTTNLIQAINAQSLQNDYQLVTLLIGVNNQYQGLPFSVYQDEFAQLVQRSITLAQGIKEHVIVVSIPDYAYTPFGQSSANPQAISSEINQYNTFARTYCQSRDIPFVNITDITREGLDNPELVASDGLHPSGLAYTRFVNRILQHALQAFE